MVLIFLHNQRSRSTSGLCTSGVSTFLVFLLPKRFYLEFMIFQRVSFHRSTNVDRFGSSGFGSFKTFLVHFLLEFFHPKSTILRHVSFGINGRYALHPSDLQEFLTQCNLSPFSPLECPVSRLYDLSSRGEILEENTWPNQVGDTCHVLTDISIIHMLKTY
jgi:hypothetical protein